MHAVNCQWAMYLKVVHIQTQNAVDIKNSMKIMCIYVNTAI